MKKCLDIRLVARRASVSISTVSRVLNNSGYVSAETRKNVTRVVKELGYRQNNVAKSLRKKVTNFIGLIVPDISNEFFATLARSVEDTLQRHGFSLFLCNTGENQAKEKLSVESLLASQVRGIVLASAGFKTNQRMFTSGVPVVLVDRMQFEINAPNVVYIESDNHQGARLAGDTLLAKGAKRLIFLRDQRKVHPMDQREQGFAASMQAAALPPSRYRVYAIEVSSETARQRIVDIYEEFPFDGLFCGTDTIAVGALKGLTEAGHRVPEEIQIVGFDGISLGAFLRPPLSTIKQDIETMGHMAGQKMVKLINRLPATKHIVLKTEFVERGTTR